MKATFHLFPDLPAELRVQIWCIALEEEYEELSPHNRIFELHHYNPKKKETRVTFSRRYPTLFDVSREARSEAAKADGGEWVTMNARFDGRNEPKSATSFKIYFNFSQDVLFLSTRFVPTSPELTLLKSYHAYETAKLKMAFDVLPAVMIEKTTKLALSISVPCIHGAREFSGEGLERFPALKHVHLVAADTYIDRCKRAIAEHLQEFQTSQTSSVPWITSDSRHVRYNWRELEWLIQAGLHQLAFSGINIDIGLGLLDHLRVQR